MMAASISTARPSTAYVIIHNILAHFELRIASWFMAGATFGVGIAMTANPTMLTGSINAAIYFKHLNEFADQWVWRALFLMVGTSRLTALTINGSFPSICWTPHVRLVMSTISAVIWGMVAMSVLGGLPTIGTVIYPLIVLVEIHNVVQAVKDVRGTGYRDGR